MRAEEEGRGDEGWREEKRRRSEERRSLVYIVNNFHSSKFLFQLSKDDAGSVHFSNIPIIQEHIRMGS